MSFKEYKKERDNIIDEMVTEIANLVLSKKKMEESLDPDNGLVIIGKLIEE